MENKVLFKGSLGFIGLPDVLQILGSNNSNGILRLSSPYAPDRAMVYFDNGNPVNAVCGPLKGLQALHSLFGWVEGEFEFHKDEIKIKPAITQGRMEIILDALRMLDDELITKVGPISVGTAEPDENPAKGHELKLPVLKGSLLDYSYVMGDENYRDGSEIVREGGHGKWLWAVSEGVVRVSKQTEKGPLTVARMGEGCFIGSFGALLFGEYTRNATVTAEGDVKLFLLDTGRLYKEFESLPPDFRLILLSLDSRLRNLMDRAAGLYAKGNGPEKIPPGAKVVIEKGDARQELFVITQGAAYLVGENRKGRLPLLKLEKQQVFGHIPFIDFSHEPRSAWVIASDNLKIRKIEARQFETRYNSLSSKFRNLIHHTGKCISMTTSLIYHLHNRNP